MHSKNFFHLNGNNIFLKNMFCPRQTKIMSETDNLDNNAPYWTIMHNYSPYCTKCIMHLAYNLAPYPALHPALHLASVAPPPRLQRPPYPTPCPTPAPTPRPSPCPPPSPTLDSQNPPHRPRPYLHLALHPALHCAFTWPPPHPLHPALRPAPRLAPKVT